MISGAGYAAGVIALIVAIGAIVFGAVSLRRVLVPHFTGAPAHLVDAVVALALTIGIGQVLGALGALSRGWVFAGALVGGGVSGLVARRVHRHDAPAPVERPPVVRWEGALALAAAAAVAAQWSAHTAFALGRGMTHPDTLWYHMPFATRFVQEAGFRGIGDLGYPASRYYPFNAELVHSLLLLPFHRDVLSPFVNLGWVALALLAAWCIGVRAGVAPLTMLAGAVVCSLPMVAGTQPGQASTDIACAALLLSSVALFLVDRDDVFVLAISAIAGGLAIGTKLLAAPAVAVLTVAVVWRAARSHRARAAIVWSVALVVSGSFWYVRNWIASGNPLPWFGAGIGPLRLIRHVRELGASVSASVRQGDFGWDFYQRGFTQAMGHGWPLVIGLGITAAIAAVVARGKTAATRAAGIAALVGFVTYTITPLTGGLSFAFNLRYLTTALLLAFVLGPLALAGAPIWARVTGTAVLAIAFVLAITAKNSELVPAWPSRHAPAAALGAVVVLAGAVTWLAARRARALGALVVATSVIVAGVSLWFVQRQYTRTRYVGAELTLDALNTRFRSIHDARVAVYGTVEVYPMFGLDLSNDVVEPVGPSKVTDPCRTFRGVRSGRYDYVVLTHVGLVSVYQPPGTWFADRAHAAAVYRDPRTVVYHVTGPLANTGC